MALQDVDKKDLKVKVITIAHQHQYLANWCGASNIKTSLVHATSLARTRKWRHAILLLLSIMTVSKACRRQLRGCSIPAWENQHLEHYRDNQQQGVSDR